MSKPLSHPISRGVDRSGTLEAIQRYRGSQGGRVGKEGAGTLAPFFGASAERNVLGT